MSGLINRLLIAGLVFGFPPLHAHQATEQYIPIGYSSGVSPRAATYIGRVTAYNARQTTLSIAGDEGVKEIRLEPTTEIWLDRSKVKKPNRVGDTGDLKADRRVEVKYVDPAMRKAAQWIKVEITE